MSTEYKKPSQVPTAIICKRLKELSNAIAKGNTARGHFSMRVPAEVDHDADIVLAEAAKRLEAAEDGWDAYKELRKEVAEKKYPNLTNTIILNGDK